MDARALDAMHTRLCDLSREARYYLHFHERLATRYQRFNQWCALGTALASSGNVVAVLKGSAVGWSVAASLGAALAAALIVVFRFSDLVKIHGDLARRYLELDAKFGSVRYHVERNGYDGVLNDLDELHKAMTAVRASEPSGHPFGSARLGRKIQECVEAELPDDELCRSRPALPPAA